MDQNLQQEQLLLWQQQWEQDLHAQSLLNATEEYQNKTAVGEFEQEDDIQKLLKRFSHVEESVVYATYFEQSEGKFDMACNLLKAQFPEDPAYQAQKKEEEAKVPEVVDKVEEETPAGETWQPQEVFSEAPQGVPVVPINESQIDSQGSSMLVNDPMAVSQVSFLEKDEQMCIDLTDEISREIFMHLKIRLEKNNKQSQFDEILKVLHQVLSNILKDPLDIKFHKLKLQNKKINQYITTQVECINLLELVGFIQHSDAISETGELQAILVIPQTHVLDNYNRIQQVAAQCNQMLSEKSVSSLIQHFEAKRNGGQKKNNNGPGAGSIKSYDPPVMSHSQKKQEIAKMANHSSNMKNKLLEAQFNRQQRMINEPHLIAEQRAQAHKGQNLDTYLGQLQHYRRMQANKYQRKRQQMPLEKRIITVDDLQKKIDADVMARNRAHGAGSQSEMLGIRSLDLTNKFRAATNEGHEGNKPALRWSKELHDIAMTHSKNMGTGKVPFSHDGFNDRMKMISFHVQSFSENVAYNQGCGDPVETAVRGWINSPGHRKNMLAQNTICGIAVYVSGGTFWFTQLFALA